MKRDASSFVNAQNRGHLTEVRLPSEIPDIVVLPAQNVVVDIDKIDFFSDRRFLNALLEREGYRCFYSLREVTKENCALCDKVVTIHIAHCRLLPRDQRAKAGSRR